MPPPQVGRRIFLLAGVFAAFLPVAVLILGIVVWVIRTAPLIPPTLQGRVLETPLAAPDFELLTEGSTSTRISAFKGKVVIVFFGYAHCPDVCPMSLATAAQAKRLLSKEDGDRLQVILVTVDPQRDTPDGLGRYVRQFDATFLGGTTQEDLLSRVAKEYFVHYEREEADTYGQYLMGHSSHMTVIDTLGNIREIVTLNTEPEQLAADIRILLRERRPR